MLKSLSKPLVDEIEAVVLPPRFYLPLPAGRESVIISGYYGLIKRGGGAFQPRPGASSGGRTGGVKLFRNFP